MGRWSRGRVSAAQTITRKPLQVELERAPTPPAMTLVEGAEVDKGTANRGCGAEAPSETMFGTVHCDGNTDDEFHVTDQQVR